MYRLEIAENLSEDALGVFDGMTVSPDHGATVLVGPISDKAQSYKLLRRVYELGLTLVSLKPI
jgi:hypothetical protein